MVIHRGEGVREEIKTTLWKWFSKDTAIKPVHYAALQDEFGFKGQAELVVIPEALAEHATIIVSQWPYETHFVVLGKPPKEIERISYTPTLEEWKGYKMIHHL